MAEPSAFTITNSNAFIVDLWNGAGDVLLQVLQPGQLSNQYAEAGVYLVHPHAPLGPEPPVPEPAVLLDVTVVDPAEPPLNRVFNVARFASNFVVQTVFSGVLLD